MTPKKKERERNIPQMAAHRTAITDALSPDLPMRLFNRQGNMSQYIGLWGAWWGDDPTISVRGLKVVLATTTGEAPRIPAEGTLPLSSIPWVILQLQAVDATDKVFDRLMAAVRTDLDKRIAMQIPNSRRCAGRIVYDATQDVHSLRTIQSPAALEAFTVTRVDEPTNGPQPTRALQRERVEFKVFRGRHDDLHPQPVRVFMERRLPKRQSAGQRLRSETGFAKVSDLLSAVQEWRTWIVLDQ